MPDNFYAHLPTLSSFLDITDSKNFVSVPDSWYIIITDIAESTKAIAAGRYKEVNLLGACSIVAILNIEKEIEIPFVFGGDGATILIPSTITSAAKEVMVATQQLARTRFGMHLRMGIVPISAVISAGFAVKIAKLKVSENYSQAMFTGGGLAYATELVKDYSIPDIYQLKRQRNPLKPDFSGLECRWQDIPSKDGEIVSLQIMAIAHSEDKVNQIYREFLERFKEIYGTGEDFNPVTSIYLHLSLNNKVLATETKILAAQKGLLSQSLYLWKIKVENLLGVILMRFKITSGGVDWGAYSKEVVATTDYQKFDDMLRMVISGNAAQSSQLMEYLEERYTQGTLVYGLHISDRALMTCLVFERNGRQVHFVDGADGGYTLAAKALKQRMQRKALNWVAYLKMLKLRKDLDRA